MWSKSLINTFLEDKNLNPDKLEAIQVRMEKISDALGNFPANMLQEVLGEEKLAEDFEKAWDSGELFAKAWK